METKKLTENKKRMVDELSLKGMLDGGFDRVLERGSFEKEIKISDKLKVTVSPITEDELIDAKLSVPDAARKDIITYSSFESLEILCRAIRKVNDVDVVSAAKEDLEKEKDMQNIDPKRFAALTIRNFLKELPPKFLNYIQEEYNSLVKEQSEAIKGALGEEIENF